MKNNKALVYALLTLVIGIWGYVIYSIVVKVQEPDLPIVYAAAEPVQETDLRYYRWHDSLTYDSVLRSPFQETAGVFPAEDSNLPSTEEAMDDSYDPLMYAPALDIQYLGYIENKNKKQQLALIRLDGKQYYLAARKSVEGITLLQITPREIRIKADGHTLTIEKQ